MNTKEHIVTTADQLIRERGYNAFSFVDIAGIVGIRKPSIHHHFPHKTDLGVAVIDYHIERFNQLKAASMHKSSIEKLDAFFSIHTQIQSEGKVCLVGSLAPDYYTLEDAITDKLQSFAGAMLEWVATFLEAGRNEGVFHFETSPRTKALLLISNMVAMVPISRLTKANDFKIIKEALKKELLTK